jgi:hypothetical protein
MTLWFAPAHVLIEQIPDTMAQLEGGYTFQLQSSETNNCGLHLLNLTSQWLYDKYAGLNTIVELKEPHMQAWPSGRTDITLLTYKRTTHCGYTES